MSEIVLTRADQVMPYAEQVRILADAHRHEFGFLPKNAYAEAATRNNLWVSVDKVSRILLGYILFGGQHPQMKVFQVCIQAGHRSRGVARKLVSQLIKYGGYRGFLRITARVSSKLEANRFWQAIGFYIVKQVSGGGSSRGINIYAMDLDVPSLFDEKEYCQSSVDQAKVRIDLTRPMLTTPSYVADLNVFFDVVRNRDTGQGDQIVSAALRHDIRLFVTPEFKAELQRTTQDRHNDPVLAFAKSLPTLRRLEPNHLRHLLSDIKSTLISQPPGPREWTENDNSDHIHLAYSIHHRAFGFITRDGAVLRNSERIHDEFGLRVLSPTDVAYSLQADERYSPATLTVTSPNREIQVSEITPSNRTIVERFLNTYGDDELCRMPSSLQDGAHYPPLSVVITSNERVVALGQWSSTPGFRRHAVLSIVVDEDHVDAYRAIDHILGYAPTAHEGAQLWLLNLRVLRDHLKTIETALKRGFHPQRTGSRNPILELSRISIQGVVTPHGWRTMTRGLFEETSLRLPPDMPTHQEMTNTGVLMARPQGLGSWRMSLFDFETFVAPGLLISPGRCAVIVPIKEAYAEELLPETRRQGLLMSRYDAALRLERAYFFGTKRHRLLPRGTLVVFYVSHPRSQAVAIARVTFSDTLTTTQAVMNLGRQGVLTASEIQSLAVNRDEITVFTFDNLLTLFHSIDFKKLKQIGCVSGANLRTVQRISDEGLRRIVRIGFGMDIS